MSASLKLLLGLGLLAIAPASFAQNYSMDLTGVGNGTVADGVYVSPYVGTISGPGMSYSGYMICDDFNSEAYLNTPWIASMSNAGALNGTQKFDGTISFEGSTYTIQQAYNAAGWLANGLLANLGNSTTQTNYAFAIWDIFDGQSTNPTCTGNQANNPNCGATALEAAAFAAASSSTNPYVASNVSVFTPCAQQCGQSPTQEFLVVHPAPEVAPTVAASAISLLLGGVLVLRGRRRLGA